MRPCKSWNLEALNRAGLGAADALKLTSTDHERPDHADQEHVGPQRLHVTADERRYIERVLDEYVRGRS